MTGMPGPYPYPYLIRPNALLIKRRRVFFSFHYQRDVWRANQIRNSWRFGHEGTRTGTGFFDGSLWESSKRTGDSSLKSLINTGLENTSVTCVLAGTETWLRRWVRYEIAKSVLRGNGLLTVRIDRQGDRHGNMCAAGPDPLDCVGVYLAAPDRILFAEWANGRWQRYMDYQQAVKLPPQWQPPLSTSVVPLSTYARSYCYVADYGSQRFASWVEAAAQGVGK